MKKSIKKVLLTCTAVAVLTSAMGTAALAAVTYEDNTLAGYDVPADMEEKQVTILVVPHDAATVTDENIFFIDQSKGGNFVVKPKVDSNNVLADGKYDIRVGGEGIAAADIKITEFEIKDGKIYVDDDIILGDVNDDKEVNLFDVTLLVQYLIGNKDLTERQLKAAEVDGKPEELNVFDATRLVQYLVGNVDSLG
jgi:hypothetical protein